MIRKLLIANRGEIAVRIIRTCREMGIQTVAVYSEADRDALHVYLADEARAIGGALAAESYLDGEAILAAAKSTSADALHPGYGFLAENGDFARQVIDAGLTFIGPSPDVIRTMGSKTAARDRMIEAGVPVVPGYQAKESDEALQEAATEIGYPILVKAVGGGGGKGMRLVQDGTGLKEGLQSARREAQAAFGDGSIYLEKWIPNARHIEIQIAGDHKGNLIHLGERDCSIQRRHQKIVEETPSPALYPDLRKRMGSAAVEAGRAVGYTNLGTVEFLLDENEHFYFLEMNTRIQVEHPVTEMIYGIDLVRWQIRIANGDPLPQHPPTPRGHAIECRIYAEDPANGFLPAPGTLDRLLEPAGPGIRVDSGVRPGEEITTFYDPMLAKLIVHAEDRAAAIGRMNRGLSEFVVLGDLTTNVPFLRDVMSHPLVLAGEATTDFVESYFSDWQPVAPTPSRAALVAAALAFLEQTTQATGRDRGEPSSAWDELRGLRN